MKKLGLYLAAFVALMIGVFGVVGPVVSASAVAVAPEPAPAVKIVEFGTNAPGADNSGNRNREYVKIQNTTGAPLNVEGWAIHDGYQNAAGDFSNGYTLRGVNLPAGSPFRGAGADSTVPTDDQFVIPTGGTVTVYNGERFGGRWMWSDATRLVIYRDFKHVYNNGGDKITVANGDTSITSADYSPYRVRLG